MPSRREQFGGAASDHRNGPEIHDFRPVLYWQTFGSESKDLEAIRTRALAEGLPYQTLISSLLHKYAAGRLKEGVMRAFPRLSANGHPQNGPSRHSGARGRELSGHETRSVFDRYNGVSDGDLREAASRLGHAGEHTSPSVAVFGNAKSAKSLGLLRSPSIAERA